MAPGLYRHPTRSEVLELAAEEGHDADIPTNAGSIRDTQQMPHNKLGSEKASDLELEKDIEKGGLGPDLEKGARPESVSSSEAEEEQLEDNDPDIIWWDGPDDPQNPLNWPFKKKWGTVILVSAITFLTPLASSMFAPGVPKVMETFHSTSQLLEGKPLQINGRSRRTTNEFEQTCPPLPVSLVPSHLPYTGIGLLRVTCANHGSRLHGISICVGIRLRPLE
jgi:hypothetical protein